MHPIPTVLLGGPQDGPECWIGQQCMRWEANPRSLLPLLEFFFGNITISFFHPVPALENFLVRNQMQLFKFAMLCNLWHEAIFPIIVIVISKLENISTLLAKAATTVSFGAPRKFGSLTIHNKKAKLQEESFANCCMPWWLLQLQSQILHIPIAAVKYRLQPIKISNWTLRSLTRRLSSSILVYMSYIGQAATHWAHQCFQVLEHLENPHQEGANDANAQFHKHGHLVKVQVTMWSLECCGAKVLEVLADSMHWTSSCWSHFKAYPHRTSYVFDSFTCVNLIVNCL